MSSSWPPPPDQPPGQRSGPQQSPSTWQPVSPEQPQAGERPVYPQQTLSEQQVRPGRSRKPLLIGLVAALLLAIAAGVAWQLLKDDGEDTRAAYCSALKTLTHNGDLLGAASGADASSLNQLAEVQRLAPDVVSDDWDDLQSAAQSAQSGNVDFSQALKGLTSLRAIADDADSKCGITMDVPGLP